jgi:hypothetical protein
MRPEDWNTDNSDALTSNVLSAVTRALGLLHENAVLDQTFFNGFNRLTSGRLRTYDTKQNAEDAGGTGLQSTYTIEVTYQGGNVQTYTVVREGS